MSDKVELYVNNKIIEHFISYVIDAELYTPADAFKLQFADPGMVIKPGMPCTLKINGNTELTGIIDKVEKSVDKSGTVLNVEGRDYMGVLVDAHCEKFISPAGKKISEIAEILIADLRNNNSQFSNFGNIYYQENIVGRYKSHRAKSSSSSTLASGEKAQKIQKIEPGATVFEVLNTVAKSRGMLFWCNPDGLMIIGRPMAQGEPEYFITLKKNGIGNNVIKSVYSNDISKRFSQVTVVGQQQGQNSHGDTLAGAKMINTTKKTVKDPSFPFFKPFVAAHHNDAYTPDQYSRLILEKQRRDGIKLTYTVARHLHEPQGGKKQNWRFNAFCKVVDEAQGINDDFLIYGRTFELSKANGATTTVHLGPPGFVAV